MTWYEVILCKVIKNTSETLSSLDNYGVDYLLKIYEYLTFEDYVQDLHVKDADIKRGQQRTIRELDTAMKRLIPDS
ncbi:hypothetical protein [Escherichia phage EC_OE_11]|nr:hypothetical protein bas62_0017 [Escherichia phage JohannJBalmer]WBF54144.1 hypothetical protein [Escherichia phage EC_OE_11]